MVRQAIILLLITGILPLYGQTSQTISPAGKNIVPYSHPDDLASLMDSLHIGRAVLLGLSMGGYIAIDFALKNPERVNVLIAVSSGLTGYNFKDPQILEYNAKLKTKENRSDPPAIGRLAEIKKPILTIVGDLDQPGILEIAAMIGKQVPGTQKSVIKGAAHLVNMEKPDDFNATVIKFLHSYESLNK
jgi:3-oxoadipate enol-lactonase